MIVISLYLSVIPKERKKTQFTVQWNSRARMIRGVMKVLAFLVLLFALNCNSKSSLKFTFVKCGVSLKSAVEPYCYIKAYTRKYPMLNFGFRLLRNIPDGSVWKLSFFFQKKNPKNSLIFQAFYDYWIQTGHRKLQHAGQLSWYPHLQSFYRKRLKSVHKHNRSDRERSGWRHNRCMFQIRWI